MAVNPGVIAKAINGAFIAGGAATITALQDGTISNQEIVGIVLAFVVTGLTVYSTPNDLPATEYRGEHEAVEVPRG